MKSLRDRIIEALKGCGVASLEVSTGEAFTITFESEDGYFVRLTEHEINHLLDGKI